MFNLYLVFLENRQPYVQEEIYGSRSWRIGQGIMLDPDDVLHNKHEITHLLCVSMSQTNFY